MAKVILGARPKSIPHTVEFPMLDGSTGAIEIQYVYRTRTEFGELVDSMNAAAAEKQKAQVKQAAEEPKSATTAPAFSLKKHNAETLAGNADFILQIATGWNLDVEFNHANLVQLGDEQPPGFQAIMDDYRRLINEGRQGN